ncbi:MAG: hypothetical protein M3Y71_11005 [Actinomycetota bacterium]|nr:hypothetical protein [Actinomycetota bacterium]
MTTMRFRRLAAVLAVTLGAGLLTTQVAVAAQGPYVANKAVTRVYHGATYTVLGYATPGTTVVLHYHRAGTAANDYSIERSVRAAADGFWVRESVLDVDYRVFATVGTGNPHSATVLFTSSGATAPVITGPSQALPFGQLFTVRGTAAPFIQVQLHYRRTSAPTVDIARTVYTDENGAWSRTAVLDTSYTAFATIGLGHPHSATVTYTGHQATVGDKLDIDYAPTSGTPDNVLTTLGVEFRSYVDPRPDLTPPAGSRYTEAYLCVRNRGPQVFSDDPVNAFVLLDGAVGGRSAINPESSAQGHVQLDLTTMAVGELRCGALLFVVPLSSTTNQLAYAPGLLPNYYEGRWTVPSTPGVTTTTATSGATAHGAVSPQVAAAGGSPVRPAAR